MSLNSRQVIIPIPLICIVTSNNCQERESYLLTETRTRCVFVPSFSSQKLVSKNFSEEIRAAKDIETFLERPTLLLGLQETSLEGIVDAMLKKIITDSEDEDINFEDARIAFFTQDSGQTK